MSGELADRAFALVREALDLAPHARDALLAAAISREPALEAPITRLLARLDDKNSPLDRPPGLTLIKTSASAVGLRPSAGQRVGAFALERMLGAGGMGEVWLAHREHGGFAQTVAIKWLGAIRSDGDAARFEAERALLARLDHPGIARIVDGGREGDVPWFAMEYVDGVALDAYVGARRLTLDATVGLVRDVLDAIIYLHQNLVVHRDLKPANILVDAEARPRLLDFGVAKLLDDSSARITDTRAPISVAYAAPEQVAGGAITTATDVYALGAVLYELLCGEPPHSGDGGSLPQRLRAIAHETAAPPSAILARDPARRSWRAQALTGDLDTVVATCLAIEPARRYPSATALAADLRRYLAREPIAARRASFGYRLSRALVRHPFAWAASAAAVLALIGAMAFSFDQARRAQAAASQAEAERQIAARERDAARVEVNRQEALREHFVAVVNRATAGPDAITPDALLELIGDVSLSEISDDPATRSALLVSIANVYMVRNDFRRLDAFLALHGAEIAEGRAADRAEWHQLEALAAIRLGDVVRATASVDAADALIATSGLEGSMTAANALMLRAQLARARGDAAAALDASSRAAAIAERATVASALERGTVISNHAVNLLMLGRSQEAIATIERARAIWRGGGISMSVNTAVAAAIIGNAHLVEGEPAKALAEFDQIDAVVGKADAAPAQAARKLARARALAFLGRSDAAVAEAENATVLMCQALGETAGDCLRAIAGAIDVGVITGDRPMLAAMTGRLRPSAAALPPQLIAQLTVADAWVALQSTANRARSQQITAFIDALDRAAKATPKGANRGYSRIGLWLAERARVSGDRALAEVLAGFALDSERVHVADTGFDGALAELWRARLAGAPAPSSARERLIAELGPDHWIVRAN